MAAGLQVGCNLGYQQSIRKEQLLVTLTLHCLNKQLCVRPGILTWCTASGLQYWKGSITASK